METWGWFSVGIGAALVLLTFYEVWITIYHKDIEGALTRRVQRLTWDLVHALSKVWRSRRRDVLSFAGPLVMVATFVLWFTLFILGFTLIVWPNLDAYRTADGLSGLGFIDALYYTGVTGTVLGYGDITPLTPAMKLVTVLISGTGFLILTAGITYLLSVVNGTSARNSFALRVRTATDRTWDGVHMVGELMHRHDATGLRERVEDLSSTLRTIQEQFHQFPILDLFYRSRQDSHDPEPMLHALAEAALAIEIIAQHEPTVEPSSHELTDAITGTMFMLARHHMKRRTQRELKEPAVMPQDRERFEQARSRLSHRLGKNLQVDQAEEDALLRLVARTRIFDDELDKITSWRSRQKERSTYAS